jgi:hypothetical protein
MNKKSWGYILILMLAFGGCRKENICDCLKSTGEIIKETRQLGEFERINLDNNINLIITQDSSYTAVIESGENLMSLIKTDVKDNCLYIKNDNVCNWVRSYKKEINVYLTLKKLSYITNTGSGDITSTDTIFTNIIGIENVNGSGTINMILKSKESYFFEILGPADFIIKGKSGYNYIWASGYGKFDCSELSSSNSLTINNGTNNCFVNVSNNLDARITGTGNIYYKGNPKSIESDIKGDGRLIKQ